jgi:hypothetical protein
VFTQKSLDMELVQIIYKVMRKVTYKTIML